mmetsp:Transcript_36490/g.84184  ORF Transcript_36490/g.84184 Transcript_36490/m.84184 type:complete len:243 (-) Transcript_36490:69-797(-)
MAVRLVAFFVSIVFAQGHLHQRKALRKVEIEEVKPIALVSPAPLTPISRDEVSSAAELARVEKELKTSEMDQARIVMLKRSLETQRVLVSQSQAVAESFAGNEYPSNVVREQQEKLQEFEAQTREVLNFSTKAAKEASQQALTQAVAIQQAAMEAQKEAQTDRMEAKKASELSAKLASEATVELQRLAAVTAAVSPTPQRRATRPVTSPSRLQRATEVRKTNSSFVEEASDDASDSNDGDLD